MNNGLKSLECERLEKLKSVPLPVSCSLIREEMASSEVTTDPQDDCIEAMIRSEMSDKEMLDDDFITVDLCWA